MQDPANKGSSLYKDLQLPNMFPRLFLSSQDL